MLKNIMSSKKQTFSKSDWKIYNYLIDANNDWRKSSITQVSKKIGVSNAAITRFCQKINFSGWKECQNTYKMEKENSSFYEGVEQSLNEIIYSLSRTDEQLNKESLKIIAKKIISTNRVFLYGESFTMILAKYFQMKLNKISINATYVNVASESGSILPKENSVHIMISTSGMNPNIKFAVEKLRTISVKNQTVYSIGARKYCNVEDEVNEHVNGLFFQANNQNQFELPSLANHVIQYILDILFKYVYEENEEYNNYLIERFAVRKIR
ncbi:MurR/RpiR family transcriptional regulator [Mycoplasma marinum]|uniref:MurR/RpiR family transcriptional regulator n=1 Tax=Mycoplasma marinum TaxID=1937190 RepID=A0A4R0XRT8_9MOLU|nr:MurR/RpiR family transcriptional regulator [Mycoplasma marinum]TCG10269.1 hypothetical protein C4B24_04965 [Mycoplasma marinum]